MSTGNWIELSGLIMTALSGGSIGLIKLLNKLTRIAIAVEQSAKVIEGITTIVSNHEDRLKRAGL